ncbi:hypothetical protein BDF22DRAFT_402 [Syncephalis plumigaleata]|nr:hypothetical protein BDF22DRAFT_402 [Syncephalis plumigaleata]
MEELKQKMRRANLEDIFGIKPNEEGELSGGESTSVSPEGLTEEEVTEDIPFQRVCALIELMRREATAALEFTAILPGGRVLTAEELEDNLTEPNESTLPETLPCTDDVAMTSLDPIESTSDVTSQPVPSLQDTSSHITATLTSNSTGSTRVRELLNVLAQRAIANDHGATTTTTTTTTHLSQEGTVNTTAIISELETLLLTENTATRATTTTSTRKSSKGDTTRPGGNHHHSPPSSRPPTRVPGPSEMRRGQSSQQTGVGTTTTSTLHEHSNLNVPHPVAIRQAAAAAASSNGNNNNNTTTTNTSYTPRRTPSSRTRPNNATSTTVNRATSLTASTARAK